jgi:hypothetical protein
LVTSSESWLGAPLTFPVSGKPVGDCQAGGAAADDDVVIFIFDIHCPFQDVCS